MKISVLNCLPVEEFNACHIYILLHTQKYSDRGIWTAVKANELSSVMAVFVTGLHHGWGLCQKSLSNLEYLAWLKNALRRWSTIFLLTFL